MKSEELGVAGLEGKKGLRCQVCTGCGLCPGVTIRRKGSGIHILTEESFGTWDGDRNIMDLEKTDGFHLVAVDIGTTTIAMELCGEDGRVRDTFVTVNPQVKFGSDVISRITAARDPQNRKELRELVKGALTQGAKRFLKCLPEGNKFFFVIAANTTMSYLLMGWDPAELGEAPFEARHLSGAHFFLSLKGEDRAQEGQGQENKAAQIPCVLLPGISAFVGADVFAGISAAAMAKKEELTLLLDLGTNGEMALGNCRRILTTATAAGPAFEGGANRGIWGADMVHMTAELLREGILDETGLLAEPYFTKGIRIGNVLVTKESVRSIQLAKAAIAAGIRILCREYGISVGEIDHVILAGGFGYYLQAEDAVRIGMLPRELMGKTISGGNTALFGAKKIGALLLHNFNLGDEEFPAGEGNGEEGFPAGDGNGENLIAMDGKKDADPFMANSFMAEGAFRGGLEWKSLMSMPQKMEVLNLAMHPDFSDEYVRSMQFQEFI